jgi:hypothetical protein
MSKTAVGRARWKEMSQEERKFAQASFYLASLCGLIMFHCSSGLVTQEIKRLLLLITDANSDARHFHVFLYAKQLYGTLGSILVLPGRGLRTDVDFSYPWEWLSQASSYHHHGDHTAPHHWDLLVFEAKLLVESFVYESEKPKCGPIGFLGLDINLSITAHDLCMSRARETKTVFRYGVDKPLTLSAPIDDQINAAAFDRRTSLPRNGVDDVNEDESSRSTGNDDSPTVPSSARPAVEQRVVESTNSLLGHALSIPSTISSAMVNLRLKGDKSDAYS